MMETGLKPVIAFFLSPSVRYSFIDMASDQYMTKELKMKASLYNMIDKLKE